MSIASWDTETAGVDFRHGAKPFFVTTCDGSGEITFWEWDVNPITREPLIPKEDIEEIKNLIYSTDWLVLQNAKFDVTALSTISQEICRDWRWEDTHDTLTAGHVLASNKPHDLTSMAVQYLGVDILPLEQELMKEVNAARRLARSYFPDWNITTKDNPDIPSAKGSKLSKFDYWLPRATVKALWENSEAYREWLKFCESNTTKLKPNIFEKALSKDKFIRNMNSIELPGWEYRPPKVDKDYSHPWWTVLSKYANADSGVTLPIWKQQERYLKERGFYEIYDTKRKINGIIWGMESRGLTLYEPNLKSLITEYESESVTCGKVCVNIASNFTVNCDPEKHKGSSCTLCNGVGSHPYNLTLPKGGSNNSLKFFLLNVLRLEPEKFSKKTGEPSLDAGVLADCLSKLPSNSLHSTFLRNLMDKRKRDTAMSYMISYKRFWKPLSSDPRDKGWYKLFPSLNPTGTATTRFSSSNPNEQNISKKEDFNIRLCFGPAPGREWWSVDAENIELRIPAYESGEAEMISLFERPKDPPYYGSNHLLVCHTLHKELFESCLACDTCKIEINNIFSVSYPGKKFCECTKKVGFTDGRIFKERYASTRYQWVKNGNFAVQYGAIPESGTADRAYHVPGGQIIVQSRFAKLKELNQKQIRFAEKHGYVETMIDKTVSLKHGYPLLCSRTDYGKVKPTVPLNYHVQGTAGWWMHKAMIRCEEKLEKWRSEGFNAYMTMSVHDEIVFDLPKSETHPSGDREKEKEGHTHFRTSNLWRIRLLQKLMEEGGKDIGIPTPTSCTYHENNWSEGVKM